MDEDEEEQAWERDRLGLREGECSYGYVCGACFFVRSGVEVIAVRSRLTHPSPFPTPHRRGYVTQLVFICETCQGQATSSSNGDDGDGDGGVHGLCVSCAHQCHGILGHTLRNLGEKRAFRCGGFWGA